MLSEPLSSITGRLLLRLVILFAASAAAGVFFKKENHLNGFKVRGIASRFSSQIIRPPLSRRLISLAPSKREGQVLNLECNLPQFG